MTPSEEKARDLILEMQTALVDANDRATQQARELDAANGELAALREENVALRTIGAASDLDVFIDTSARPWFDAFRAAVQPPQENAPQTDPQPENGSEG
jgi:hypothetical protein